MGKNSISNKILAIRKGLFPVPHLRV